ncbi:MAG TPA: nicotinate (nicotinamide) nucleotide adenylyltransferase [Terracidiphilus sp.]|jgi:nicotinate-nucleotide adenylyltransferase
MEPSSHGTRVAFFGGSFDPPHLGHLAVARAARAALRLDTVLFAPVGAQPLKPHGATAPFADRVAMTERAIANEPGFAVSLTDAPNADGKPNYTLETLRRLRGKLAAEGSLFCLMGADSLAGLRGWYGAAEIPFTAALVVASRPGQRIDDLAQFLPRGLAFDMPGGQGAEESADPSIELRSYRMQGPDGKIAPFYLLPGLDVEISASAIRAQFRSGALEPDAGQELLPAAVAAYIRSHGLYGER